MNFFKYIFVVYIGILIGFISCSDDETLFLQRSHDLFQFSYMSSTQELLVLSNGNWNVISEDEWISLSPTEGRGDGKTEQAVQVTVSRNMDTQRTGSIQLINSKKTLTINVKQEDGFFSLGNPTMSSNFILEEELVNEKVEIPYRKALEGDKVSVAATMSGPGSEGLSIESLTNFELENGDGTIPLVITGTPTQKGTITVNLSVEISSTGKTIELIAESISKLPGEIVVKLFKVLPRLAILDWGDYEKGTGPRGDNGTSRKFILEIAKTEDGAPVRRYANQVDWLSATSAPELPHFYEHNRFVFANLEPNTTYWFRIVARGLGANKDQDSDVTTFEFKTPAEEPLGPNVILYKDFDNFWFGGNPIYQAFGVHPTEAQIGTNIDPADPVILATDYRTNKPVENLGDMFAQKNNANHNIGPIKAANLWSFYWEGNKYGTNYGDPDYPGWTGGLALPNTGGIRLASASAPGFIKTPKLAEIGEGTANITVTVNSAPYFEPYHNWGEDHLQHYIIVDGPGTITDGGATKSEPTGAATPNSDKQVTVICNSNVNSVTKGPSNSYTIPTTHIIKVSGATKDTRIEIRTHPYSGTAHYRIFLDDIKITRN